MHEGDVLVEFRLGEGAEGAEGAVDGRLLVDLDDVLAHRLVGDEELAALRARDVADVGVLLDVLRVAVAPVSGERTLVTLEELHSIVDDHLMTREHVRLEGSLDVGLEGTFGTDERHVLVVSNGVSLQLRLVRKRPSALVADVASDSKVDLVDVLLQAQRSLEVATALVTGEGFRGRMLQHVGLQRPFTRTGVVATLMGTVLQLERRVLHLVLVVHVNSQQTHLVVRPRTDRTNVSLPVTFCQVPLQIVIDLRLIPTVRTGKKDVRMSG